MNVFSKKYQSLKSKKEIADLFSSGEKMKAGAVLMLYQISNDTTKVAFTVKKKDFKKAVDRNKIKRLLKESFRLNQNELKNNYSLFFIHLGQSEHPYSYYFEKIKELLIRLNENQL